MAEATSDLLSAAEHFVPEVVELRRELHTNPELGLHLPGTQQRILESLTGLGLDITLGESAMHACGHDSHVAMLVGAAELLSARENELIGRVRFMFQPGEEGFHGARYMIEEGVLEGVDRAFAIHVNTTGPVGVVECRGGPLLASGDELRVTVNGRGGHASAPHTARDPIPAAAAMVGAIQTMITREVDVFDPAVVTIARIASGTTSNIIPEVAHIEGTIRSVSEETRELVHASIRRVVSGVADTYGCACNVDIIRGYPVTINDPAMAQLVERAAKGVLGRGRYVTAARPLMASEDFSYVLQNVPGAMMELGARPAHLEDPQEAAALHSNRMVLNEDVLSSGIAMHAALAMAEPV